ncbi:uncharacterized protein LOC116127677 [Pistacia vera]|uniref:uncharacterized protein LOC116127677 n=1 Tax=Pistacia vera TaxID=55513 RepID=UPI001263A197|nr:uncharacterized protein LOC116127677 [Pistacia vera]
MDFMEGRKIGNNILLSQKLYHYNRGSDKVRRYAIKVDLLKAYDSVRWNFILKTLKTLKFSIALNEELTGIFRGTKGLKEGDPISPYLFVIAMEILSRLMFKVATKEDFKYHWRCKNLNLTHHFFADNIMFFCYVDKNSIMNMKNAIDLFSCWLVSKQTLPKVIFFYPRCKKKKSSKLFSGLKRAFFQ